MAGAGAGTLKGLALSAFRGKPFADRFLVVGQRFRTSFVLQMTVAQRRITHCNAVLMIQSM
jgi:hypothetical protein